MKEEFRKEGMPKKTSASKILSAYSGGEPFIEGVEYTAFGRKKEVDEFFQTLQLTSTGAGVMKAYVGQYGVGKSFVMALFQSLAIKKGFVVMTTAIDPRSMYFAGTDLDRQGPSLYRSLIENTAIKTKTKGALNSILENWYNDLKGNEECGLQEIYSKLDEETFEFNSIPAYGDIKAAIKTRFREINDNSMDSKAMEYFLARYTKKSELVDVGAKDYIRENTWFEVLNALSHMFVAAGYKGLVVMVDQIDFLITLPKLARISNYNKMLSIWSQINQGRTEYLSFILFGADTILYDKRGVQTITPLYERMKESYVINTLPKGELVGLLTRLQQIHEFVFTWKSGFDEEYINDFINSILENSPMSGNCVRPISKAWIIHLNERQRDSSSSYSHMIDEVQKEMLETDEDVLKKIQEEQNEQ